MSDIKKCKRCGNEFTGKETRGSEQLYCTSKCRQEAQYERLKKRLRPNEENESEKTGTASRIDGIMPNSASGKPENEPSFSMERTRREISTDESRGINLFALYVGALSAASEAKTDVVRHQLRADALERENQTLRAEISELQAELEEMEGEEREGLGKVVSGLSEAIPGLVKSFKEEPEATLTFVKKAVGGIFTS
jgi:hypothetical protein